MSLDVITMDMHYICNLHIKMHTGYRAGSAYVFPCMEHVHSDGLGQCRHAAVVDGVAGGSPAGPKPSAVSQSEGL